MSSIIYRGPKQISIETLPKPAPSADQALIKVAFAGVCGSDVHLYHGHHPRLKPGIIIGHEFSGEIMEFGGSEHAGFEIGDKVVIEPLLACGTCRSCIRGYYNVCKKHGLIGIDMNGGFSDYAVVPVKRLHHVPEGLSLEAATLTEPLSVAVHAVRQSNLKLGDSVIVLGGGPIGLFVAQAARAAGAGMVMVSEVSDFRLQKARDLGFITIDGKVSDPIEEAKRLTNGDGADVTFDAAGLQITARQSLLLTAIRGQIVIVAQFIQAPQFDLQRVNNWEYNIIGIREYTEVDYSRALRLLSTNEVDAAKMITHKMPITDFVTAIEKMEKSSDVLKILVKP
jgi:(R,R)-butanediol dehydrogenase / meso-butanediol dehydrogenase / diacetyl reductase